MVFLPPFDSKHSTPPLILYFRTRPKRF